MARSDVWTHEHLILAFNLYNKTSFGRLHAHNPDLIALGKLIGRSVNAVALKLCNFAQLDPALQHRGIKGMSHGSKGDKLIWEEFTSAPESLAFESERILADKIGKSVEESAEIETYDLPPAGMEREALVKVRVNQSFFRKRILSAYNYQCCVTGLTVPQILVASHIIP